MTRSLVLAGLALAVLTGRAPAQGKTQMYAGWKKASDGRYYCEYLYKSKKDDSAYKKQYVIYDPKDPKWVYWSNPASNPDNKTGKDVYWARCPTKAHPTLGKQVQAGKDIWSMLPDGKKPNKYEDLRDADFGPPKEMSPPVPGSSDGRSIPCPPDPPDLPK